MLHSSLSVLPNPCHQRIESNYIGKSSIVRETHISKYNNGPNQLSGSTPTKTHTMLHSSSLSALPNPWHQRIESNYIGKSSIVRETHISKYNNGPNQLSGSTPTKTHTMLHSSSLSALPNPWHQRIESNYIGKSSIVRETHIRLVRETNLLVQ